MHQGSFKPPTVLIFDQNVSKNFEKFLQAFNIYLEASELTKESDERKIAIFLNVAGEEAIDIFNTFKLSNEEKKNYKKVIDEFQEYCKPRCNETYERFKFFSRNKHIDESYDSFIKDLKLLAKQCNFESQEESLIRDRLVLGTCDNQLQERLLRTPDLKLVDAEKIVRAAEATQLQVRGLKGEAEVNSIRRKPVLKKSTESTADSGNKEVYHCYKCGTKHRSGQCIAFGQTCRLCKKPNHFAIGCRFNKNVKRSGNRYKNFNNNKKGKNVSSLDEDKDFCIDTIRFEINNINNNRELQIWEEKVKINGVNVIFKLDTGSQCNVLTLRYLKTLKIEMKLVKQNFNIVAYGENKIKVVGYIIVDCIVKSKVYKIKFVAVNVSSKPIWDSTLARN